MRLRTAESYWLIKNGLIQSYPCLKENLDCEILVIGAGITGALISHSLCESGHDVVVVDKGDVAFGSTSATTSMLQYEIDVTLKDLTDKIGPYGAGLCYKAGVEAIDDLQKLIVHSELECDFQVKDSLYMAHNSKMNKGLKEELSFREDLGLPVSWLSSKQIEHDFGLKSFGGIISKKGASIDAYKLAHSLFIKNCSRRIKPLRVFDQSPIKSVTPSRAIFENGSSVRFKKIIYCSGFEATKIIPEKIAKLFDTFATVSEPILDLPDSLKNTLVWDSNDPYLYLRTTSDGRMLVGGKDTAFRLGIFREKIKSIKGQELIKALGKIAPRLTFVEDFTWGGTFGATKDGLPYIGSHPAHKNAFFVLGFGGNGITFSIQAMKIIPELLNGVHSELSHYYRFGRG